jgi:hypothetical protein
MARAALYLSSDATRYLTSSWMLMQNLPCKKKKYYKYIYRMLLIGNKTKTIFYYVNLVTELLSVKKPLRNGLNTKLI